MLKRSTESPKALVCDSESWQVTDGTPLRLVNRRKIQTRWQEVDPLSGH